MLIWSVLHGRQKLLLIIILVRYYILSLREGLLCLCLDHCDRSVHHLLLLILYLAKKLLLRGFRSVFSYNYFSLSLIYEILRFSMFFFLLLLSNLFILAAKIQCNCVLALWFVDFSVFNHWLLLELVLLNILYKTLVWLRTCFRDIGISVKCLILWL